MAIGVDHGLIGCGFHDGALVVQFENSQLAALAVDDAQIAHNARQQLRFTAVNQIVNFAFGKLADFAFHGIKQMTRQIETHGGFFVGQLLFDAPWQHVNQLWLLRAGAMGIVAHHVKQTTLIGIGCCGCGEIKRAINGRSQ